LSEFHSLKNSQGCSGGVFHTPLIDALRRKSKHTVNRKEKTETRSPLDVKRKLDIIGLLMMAAAFLLLLALLSHSHADETVADIGAAEFLRLFGGDPEIQARADTTANWLGLFGAILANFFINITVGYLSLAFPVLLMLWGWSILRRRDLRALAYYTNYTLVLILLLSTFFGLVRLVSWMPELSASWPGNIGDFVGGLISRLIGTTGGIIVILTTMIVLAVIVVDYDIQATIERGRRMLDWLRATATGKAGALNSAFRSEREAAVQDQEAAVQDQEAAEEDREVAGLERGKSAGRMTARQAVEKVTGATRRRGAGAEKASIGAAPVPPPPLNVSISRQREGSDGVADSHSPTGSEGLPPRSNGIISRDSVEGLSSLPERSDAASGTSSPAAAKKSGSGTVPVADAENPHRKERDGPVADSVPDGGTSATAADRDAASDATNPASDARNATSDDDSEGAVPLSEVMPNEHERKAVQAAVARKVMQSQDGTDADALNKQLAETELPYRFPTPDLLDPQETVGSVSDEELRNKAALVKEKLAVFGIGIKSIAVAPGPVVTLFELVPDSSVKISKITALSDDLALALAAKGIRIIAPIPGKSAVGIEIPNSSPELVSFRSVVTSPEFRRSKHRLTLGMGKSITGDVVCDDLARMPHLLIAGATGAGKSVGINVMITSLLYRMKPQQVKFVMIDPKKIELAQYRGLSRHFLALCPDIQEEIITEPTNAVIVLKSLELEMDMRYTKLAKAGVRHVDDYNAKVRSGKLRDSELIRHYQLPYIVVIIDELADLMITAAREVEEPIARLAQLARAVGVHLVVATQRPSVDVITGVIKANFPARIAYQVASRIDSRTVLDGPGADQLLGNGDMLFLPGGSRSPFGFRMPIFRPMKSSVSWSSSETSMDTSDRICFHRCVCSRSRSHARRRLAATICCTRRRG
jgi:DNA segregation ATPase FtsK/SpoIIIE, S-DNA-T family